MFLQNIKLFFVNHWSKLLTLCLIIILSVNRIWDIKPYSAGDAVEYTLMTEAFFKHYTPEIKESDCESFKNKYTLIKNWQHNNKAIDYDLAEKYIEVTNNKLLDNRYSFFADKKGRKYSCHFWFYSLINVPVRAICAIHPFNPFLVFEITNILLIVFSCFMFLKTSRYNGLFTTGFCLLFFYSTNYWYIFWEHPEVFSFCFVTVGLWLFFHNKNYQGILFVSLAALQNQPIVMLVFVLAIITLIIKGFNFKNILWIALSSIIVLLPSVFYYYHFGQANLVNYIGAVSTKFISFTRVFSLFFDLNQGMILAFPIILCLYFILFFLKIFKRTRWKDKLDLLLLPAMILMICAASTINNWNSGQAVVSRYVCYIGAVMLFHFFFLLTDITFLLIKSFLITASILSQLNVVTYFDYFGFSDLCGYTPKPVSNWVLKRYPKFYNPDPAIFINRYAPGIDNSLAETPALFRKDDTTITKLLVHRKHLNNLERYGITKHQIDSLSPHLSYVQDWAYINADENFKPSFSLKRIRKQKIEDKIKGQIDLMKATAEWNQAIKKKAKERGITEDEMFRIDAIYVLNIEPELVKDFTKDERIQYVVSKMRANAEWYNKLTEKAAKLNVPLVNVMYEDAKFMVEKDLK